MNKILELTRKLSKPVISFVGLLILMSSTTILGQEEEDTFEEISDNVAGQAKSYYLFEYCSPKRSGVNDLIIQAVQGQNQGAIRTKFDATGFTGGCK